MAEKRRSRLKLVKEFVAAIGCIVGVGALVVTGVKSSREDLRKRDVVCAQVNADLVKEISGQLQELSAELGPHVQLHVEVELQAQNDLEDDPERGYYPSAKGVCSEDGLRIDSKF